MTLRRSASRPKQRWSILIGIVVVLSLAAAATTLAVHDLGAFELEGNATAEGTPGDDWDNVCHQVTVTDDTLNAIPDQCLGIPDTTGATAVAWANDGSPNATIFSGGGSKDPEDISAWAWKDGAGGLPDKDNLVHAFAARYNVASTGASGGCPVTIAPCDVLYFGSDRFDNSGDAQQGFWFLQDEITLGGPKSGGGFGFTGTHTDGDLLILSNFSNGGEVSTINIYKWMSGGLVFVTGGENQKCGNVAGDEFCGIVNETDGTLAPWVFTDKSGNSDYLQGEFFEAGVNLSDPEIGLGGVCFASLVTETRSSTSTTATLKDFVLGGFGRCEASIATSQSWTPSDSATITVTGKTTWNGTVTFSLYPNLNCSGTAVYTSPAPIAVSQADATASTADSASGPLAVSLSGSFSWKVFFDSATTGVADEESCVETTVLTIDNDITP